MQDHMLTQPEQLNELIDFVLHNPHRIEYLHPGMSERTPC
jgi:ABC-type uncharacterized transport system YnjBCD substrate-binding protein